MKTLILAMVLVFSYQAKAQSDYGMPTLHTIQSHMFEGSYSCGGGGYRRSALFLSEHSHERNEPDLLYNGACGSDPYVEADTAGDDVAVITNLGDIPLEKVTAEVAMSRTNQFATTQRLYIGATYAVLISKDDTRALFAFKVTHIFISGEMTIDYAVLNYSAQSTTNKSSGFDWSADNRKPTSKSTDCLK